MDSWVQWRSDWKRPNRGTGYVQTSRQDWVREYRQDSELEDQQNRTDVQNHDGILPLQRPLGFVFDRVL